MDPSMLVITQKETIIRLLIAALLGGLIGLERERRNQPAGLRTHMILSIGSALAMCMSIDLAMQYRAVAPNGDPARLAAQVISGIGFLGAGAILKFGSSIKGLTTATSLWTCAVIGLAVGAGHIFSACATTVLLIVTLTLLGVLEKRWLVEILTRSIVVKAHDRDNIVHELKEMFATHKIGIKSISVAKNMETREIDIEAVASISGNQSTDELIEIFSAIKDIKAFEIH